MSTAHMLHEPHRLIGRPVRDTVSGRTGVLRAIAPDGDAPNPVAWLSPAGGGKEWTAPPQAIEPVEASAAGSYAGGRH
ncbi:hypothetical protein [Streptomyces sp. NRRL S-1831]|uniref:hypothetical protein n=1 Tax=Streptomyces sp. NRRL S-1831 TaxID=1463890 RepID=UPI0004C98CBB|nr:hypothetical protein [Streptomyces sp. NRRL S-1831]